MNDLYGTAGAAQRRHTRVPYLFVPHKCVTTRYEYPNPDLTQTP
ncbi:hypothetical protein [Vreelandella nanhaiensis]|nr:hypothetical protein [Halomonas nanhaiensis]